MADDGFWWYDESHLFDLSPESQETYDKLLAASRVNWPAQVWTSPGPPLRIDQEKFMFDLIVSDFDDKDRFRRHFLNRWSEV